MNDLFPAELVELTGETMVNDQKLVVGYQIHNKGTQSIYLWDQMVDYPGGVESIDPDRAYVFWEHPKIVRVVRAALNAPRDHEVTSREIPYVREVPAGESVKGRISLPVPLTEFSPFYPPPKAPAETTCDTIRLLIGWSEPREGMTFPPRMLHGKKVIAIRGSWGKPWQRFAELTLKTSVQLHLYMEPFDRQMPMQ